LGGTGQLFARMMARRVDVGRAEKSTPSLTRVRRSVEGGGLPLEVGGGDEEALAEEA